MAVAETAPAPATPAVGIQTLVAELVVNTTFLFCKKIVYINTNWKLIAKIDIPRENIIIHLIFWQVFLCFSWLSSN